MKILFQMIVFNSDYFLEPCIKSILPFGKLIVTEGPVEFWAKRGYSTSTDKTNLILDKYKIPTIRGVWPEKDEMMNAAVPIIPDDTDFVMMVDSDEIWDGLALTEIIKLLETNKYDSMSFKPYSFYGGFSRIMRGFEENFEWHRVQRWYPGARWATHRPPTVNAPDGVPWREHRHMNHEETSNKGIRFYHYSYVFPSQMKEKSEYYARTPGTIENYFDEVYVPWVTGGDDDKLLVERKYRGVHNWLPERRGDCYTEEFTGVHPAEIQSVMPGLVRRFNRERKLWIA